MPAPWLTVTPEVVRPHPTPAVEPAATVEIAEPRVPPYIKGIRENLTISEHVSTPCSPGFFGGTDWQYEYFHKWSPDGSRILFNVPFGDWGDVAIYSVDANGADLRMVDFGDRYGVSPVIYFDISPDGSRIAFSGCAMPEVTSQGNPSNYPATEYGIAISNLDGTGMTQLTDHQHFHNYPVWSPDGTQIAAIADRGRDIDYKLPDGTRRSPNNIWGSLTIYTMATGEWREVPLTIGDRVAPHPPAWSPDGQTIAFVAHELGPEEEYPGRWQVPRAVYTVGVDGSGLAKIAETVSEPTWSTDGERIAFAVVEGREPVIYSFAPDGSDSVRHNRMANQPSFRDPYWLGSVHWSPDGTLLLNGTPLLKDPRGRPFVDPSFQFNPEYSKHLRNPKVRALSPDGSTVAIYHPGYRLVTMAPDGTDERVIAQVNDDRDYWEFPVLRVVDPSFSLGLCAAGVVVPDPAINPGLIADCQVLLGLVMGTYAKYGELVWNIHTPLTQWPGVVVDGSPARVRGLELHGFGFGGAPPELGMLTQLRTLRLRGFARDAEFALLPAELGNLVNLIELDLAGNRLGGPIPPELGNLAQLEVLDLSYNNLTGAIPPGLGNFSDLQTLNLRHNPLSGPIPPELGKLAQLQVLHASDTHVSGVIPRELGSLAQLKTLDLSRTDLTGAIPPELQDLAQLKVLDLSGNELTGAIPPELQDLAQLKVLDLSVNELTGAIPAELGSLAQLEVLYLAGNDLTDAIPPELGNLAQLEMLALSDNDLKGAIPPELGNLLHLRTMYLDHNLLIGPIPVEISHLDRLEALDLSRNQFSGSIPAQMAKLQSLRALDINGNEFTGCLPQEFQYVWLEQSGLSRCNPTEGSTL